MSGKISREEEISIIREAMGGPFWRLLEQKRDEIRERAFANFLGVHPGDSASIAETQQMAKQAGFLLAKFEEAIARDDAEQKLKGD